MKVGRNEPCPCGSGLKYKMCCLNGKDKNILYLDSIDMPDQIRNVINGTYEFILENDYQGGCHLISVIHFILFSEMGFYPVVKIGEVQIGSIIFDHSWIELDGKVIDLAIMNTLEDGIKLPPVIYNRSASTGEEVQYEYGVSSNLDYVAKAISNVPIGKYILEGEPKGTIDVMMMIAEKSNYPITDIHGILVKYLTSYREMTIIKD